MQFGINLLAREKPPTVVEKQIIGRLKKISLLVLVVYALVTGILLGGGYYFSLESRNLSRQASQLETRIKSFQKVETLEVLIKDRIVNSQKILGARSHPEETLTKIINIVEEGVNISEIDFGVKDRLTFSVDTRDVTSMEIFLEKIKKVLAELGYQTVRLEMISRNKNGGYYFQLIAEK